MSDQLVAYARVQVVLDIGGHGPYGKDWTIESIEADVIRRSQELVRELDSKTNQNISLVPDSVFKVIHVMVRR